jgi:hypothetical protein
VVATGGTGEGNCADWTNGSTGPVGVGVATAGGTSWSGTVGLSHSCGETLRIYCLQVDFTTPLPAPEVPDGGRIAFLSTGQLPGNGAGADALCQGEGAAAFPGRTFFALRANPGAAPSAQLNLDGGAWYRPDGVLLLGPASLASATAPHLEAPLYVHADGGYEGDSTLFAWTGAPAPGAPGDAGTTCAGWTGVGNALTGQPIDAARWFSGAPRGCATAGNLYCFER